MRIWTFNSIKTQIFWQILILQIFYTESTLKILSLLLWSNLNFYFVYLNNELTQYHISLHWTDWLWQERSVLSWRSREGENYWWYVTGGGQTIWNWRYDIDISILCYSSISISLQRNGELFRINIATLSWAATNVY